MNLQDREPTFMTLPSGPPPGFEMQASADSRRRLFPDLDLPQYRTHPPLSTAFRTPAANGNRNPRFPHPPPPVQIETIEGGAFAVSTQPPPAPPPTHHREPSPDWNITVRDTNQPHNYIESHPQAGGELDLGRMAAQAATTRRANARHQENWVRTGRVGARFGETFRNYWDHADAHPAAHNEETTNRRRGIVETRESSNSHNAASQRGAGGAARTLSNLFAKKMDLGDNENKKKRVAENRMEKRRCEVEENKAQIGAERKDGPDMEVEETDVNMQDE